MVECDRCGNELGADAPAHPGWTGCPSCGVVLRVDAFPALVRPSSASPRPPTSELGDEASCFQHPGKKAVAVCESCGRFLCSLCELEFQGRRICPTCLESGRREHRMEKLENRRNIYDRAALNTAALPILFYPLTLVTAPVALYLVYRAVRSPGSLVYGKWWRLTLASILALIQVAAWSAFFLSLAG